MEKYCRAGQATDDNMAHAYFMLDTSGYKYTHSGCLIHISFPLQQWLNERVSLLRYMYIALQNIENNFPNFGTPPPTIPHDCDILHFYILYVITF